MPLPFVRRLDSLVEIILVRMEQPVRPCDHLRTVERLRPWLAKNLDHVSTDDQEFARRAEIFIASPPNGTGEFALRCKEFGDWPLWEGSGLHASADDWFPNGQIHPGAASALRQMLRENAPAGPFAERLMRRVEVTRTLCVCEVGLSTDELLLERARVCLALMESCKHWGDIRYLNTSLKALDLLWKDIRRLHRRYVSLEGMQAALLYVYLVFWQQEQLARL